VITQKRSNAIKNRQHTDNFDATHIFGENVKIIKTDNVTPQPEFDLMRTEEIKVCFISLFFILFLFLDTSTSTGYA
jgi:hypothetical protein